VLNEIDKHRSDTFVFPMLAEEMSFHDRRVKCPTEATKFRSESKPARMLKKPQEKVLPN